MRKLVAVAFIGAAAVGCGGLIAPDSTANDAASPDASIDVDGGGPDASSASGGRGPAPTPVCRGALSECVPLPGFRWTGAAIVHCDGVHYVGPWTLLLERSINNLFQTVQVQVVDKPGFGTTFDDLTSPAAQLTYRVCTVDDTGKRCGDPFKTYGPPNCACEPVDCNTLQACNVATDDGCGTLLHCGACPSGAACSATHSCCGPGFESDGTGGCVCAPARPCHPPLYWDPSHCGCEAPGRPRPE